MATDIGKVGIVMKGTWSSSTTYEVLDAVYYNNSTYISKQAVPAGTLPTNTTYWQVALDSSIIGTTDISTIGDGSLTGSVKYLYDTIKSAFGNINAAHPVTNNGTDNGSTKVTFDYSSAQDKIFVYVGSTLAGKITLS